MSDIVVSRQQAGAIRRFRNSADAAEIKALLEHVLDVDRATYEENEASEQTRHYIKANKRVIGILFEDSLLGE